MDEQGKVFPGARSAPMLARPEGCFNRSVFKSMGYSDSDLAKPLIGIANAWSEAVPGHMNLRQLAELVKRGICAAGGTPVEFGVLGACDGTGQGNEGMKYMLPHRDLVAHSVEVMVEAHRLDAVVMLGSCDKIVPGMLMAAARLGVPAILLPGGPMLGGIEFDGRETDLTSTTEAVGMLKKGIIGEDDFAGLEEGCSPTCGSCSFLGTANTMCCLAEALGMTLPHGALTPAVYADRLRLAQKTGEAIVALAKKTYVPILSHASLRNAIRVLNAIGGSTNAVMHLTAIAAELEIPSLMEDFRMIPDEVPQIVKVNPSSKYNMEHFHLAGGMPQVLRELRPLLELDVPAVTGGTLGEQIDAGPAFPRVNRAIIRPLSDPFAPRGGIAILQGNLSPATCVTKPAAIHPDQHCFTGTAIVFDAEETAEEAILAGRVSAGDVVVIRYEGPKGGPGMREMFKAMKYLYGMGLGTTTAVVTDGRFSGTNNGCFVGHVSPEAAEGGPIAVVRDGDRITIDIPSRTLTLHVDEAEIETRMRDWKRPPFKFRKGYLALYERLAASADKGAVLRCEI